MPSSFRVAPFTSTFHFIFTFTFARQQPVWVLLCGWLLLLSLLSSFFTSAFYSNNLHAFFFAGRLLSLLPLISFPLLLLQSNNLYAFLFVFRLLSLSIFHMKSPMLSFLHQVGSSMQCNDIFPGICLVLCGDIWLQYERKGSVSAVTKPFIAIFIVNILLWIDFNVTIWRRKKQNEAPVSRIRSLLREVLKMYVLSFALNNPKYANL